MKLVSIKPSSKDDKKYMAVFCLCRNKSSCCDEQKKVIHFGAKGYSDYTQHGDDDRKDNYLARHKPNEDWNEPLTAGALSRWILWNKRTLKASIADYRERFSL